MVQINFKNIIALTVSAVFIFFSMILFFTYNDYNKEKLKKEFVASNGYSLQVVEDLISTEKYKLSEEAHTIGRSDNVFLAFSDGIYLTSKMNFEHGKLMMESKQINEYGYSKIGSDAKRFIYGPNGGKNKSILFYNKKLNFLGGTDYFKVKRGYDGRYNYMNDVVDGKGLTKVSLLENINDRLYIKGIAQVSKNIRHIGNKESLGLVVISMEITSEFISKLKKIINRDIIIINKSTDNSEILLSTLKMKDGRELGDFYIGNLDLKPAIKDYKEININGVEYGFVFSPIRDYNGEILSYIGVGRDFRELNSITDKTTEIFIRNQLIATILLLVMLYLFLNILFQPLQHILQNILFIKKGNYNRRLKVRGNGELKELANSINDLAEVVEKREERLRDFNSNMEEKVFQRTKELNEYVRTLKMIASITNMVHISDKEEDVLSNILSATVKNTNVKTVAYLAYDQGKKSILLKNIIENGELLGKDKNLSYEYNYKDIDCVKDVVDEKEIKVFYKQKTGIVFLDEMFGEVFTMIPIKHGGNFFGIMLLKIDVTEEGNNDILNILFQSLSTYMSKNVLIEQNVKNENLKTIVQLLKSIVHDLKTPLVGIKGFAQMAKKKLINIDTKTELSREKVKLDRYMDIILEESDRINALAKDLLDFAGRENYDLEFEEVDIKTILEDSMKEVKNIVEASKLQINVKPLTNAPLNVDRVQIKTVFSNIIKNVSEAVKNDVKRTLEIVYYETGGFLEIEFFDNGVGISSAKLEKIFEPLFTTKVNGTGLGLSIVKNIIEKHGGEIFIKSVEGEYTSTKIRLPKK